MSIDSIDPSESNDIENKQIEETDVVDEDYDYIEYQESYEYHELHWMMFSGRICGLYVVL